jgi:hypothetical protein
MIRKHDYRYDVDYTRQVVLPIRDMYDKGEIYCQVIVYGWTTKEALIIPGGSDPFLHAVKRLGLDPVRYQAVIWDINLTPRDKLRNEIFKGLT